MSELFTGSALEAAASETPASADTSAPDPSTAAAGALPAADADATRQAAPDGSVTPPADPNQAPKDKTGPIPFDAHKTALENARLKAAQETEAKYAFAQSIPEQHRPTVGQFYQLLDTEPTNAVEVLIRTIAADPQHAPKLRSLFGKLLGNRASNPTPTPQPNGVAPNNGGAIPDPDFEDGQGNAFYSAATMRKAFDALRQSITADIAKQYGPVVTDYRTRQQREQAAREEATAKQEAATWAEQRYAKVKAWPHFEAHEAEIAAAMAADESMDEADAYVRIVVPKLSQVERQAVVTSMHDKASAAGLNPNNPASAVPGRPRSFAEGFAAVPASVWNGRA